MLNKRMRLLLAAVLVSCFLSSGAYAQIATETVLAKIRAIPALQGLNVSITGTSGNGFVGTLGKNNLEMAVFNLTQTETQDPLGNLAVALKIPDLSFARFNNKLAATPIADITLGDILLIVTANGGTLPLTQVPPSRVLTSLQTVLGNKTSIDLLSGVNFCATVKTGNNGLWGTLKTTFGIGDAPLIISGRVNADLLKSSSGDAATTGSGLLTDFGLKIAVPSIAPPIFPADFSFASSTIEFQASADGLKTVLTGGIGLTLKNKPFSLSGQIEILRSSTPGSMDFKLTGTPMGDRVWDKPLGIPFLKLSDLTVTAEVNKASGTLDFKAGLAGKISVNSKPAVDYTATLVFKDRRFDDIIFSLPSSVSLQDIPGLKDIPHIDKFGIRDLWISLQGAGGTFTCQSPKFEGSALFFTDKRDRSKLALLIKIGQTNLTTLFPKVRLKTPLVLPATVLMLSKGGLTSEVKDLPEVVKTFMSSLQLTSSFKMEIPNGLGLMAAFDPAASGPDVANSMAKIGLTGPVVIAGAIDGLFGGTPALALYAKLPSFTLPTQKMPKCFNFAKSIGFSFFFKLSQTLDFSLGVSTNVGVKFGESDLLFGAEFAVNISADAIGIGIGGRMDGEWTKAFGLNGLTAKDVLFKFTFEVDGSIGLVLAGNVTVGGKNYTFQGLGKFIIEALGFPKELAIDFTADKFYTIGFLNYLDFIDIIIKNIAAGLGKEKALARIKDPAKRAKMEAFLKKVATGPSLTTILKVDSLPIFSFKDFHIKLVTPGATDADLSLEGPAAGLKGTLVLQNKEIAIVNSYAGLEGIKIFGNFLLTKIGPLKITKAMVDIALNFEELPHFYIAFEASMFGIKKNVQLELSADRFRIFYEDQVGQLFHYTFEATTVGKDLTTAQDFSVDSKLSGSFHDWLRNQVKTEITNWKGDQEIEKAQKEVQEAQKTVDDLEKQIATQRAIVRKEREKVMVSMDKVTAEINRMKALIETKQKEYDSRKWYDPKRTKLAFEIAGLWIAVQSMEGYHEVVEGGAEVIPIDMDPRIWPLITGQKTAEASLNAAYEVLEGLQKTVVDFKKLAAKMIDEVTKVDVLSIKNAEFKGSLKAGLEGKPFVLTLDLIILGKEYAETLDLYLNPEKVITNVAKPVFEKVLAAFKIRNRKVDQVSASLTEFRKAATANRSDELLPPQMLAQITLRNFSRKNWCLVSVLNRRLVSIAGGNANDGSAVILDQARAGKGQQWKLTPTDDGFGALVSDLGGKRLSTGRQTVSPGTNVQLWGDLGKNESEWKLEPCGTSFRIKHRPSGKYLGIPARLTGMANLGVPVTLELQNRADFKFAIAKGIPSDPSRAILTTGAKQFTTANLKGSLSQLFDVVDPADIGFGTLKAGNLNSFLDIRAGDKKHPPELEIAPKKQFEGTQWEIIPADSQPRTNYVYLRNRGTGLVAYPATNTFPSNVILGLLDGSNARAAVWQIIDLEGPTFTLQHVQTKGMMVFSDKGDKVMVMAIPTKVPNSPFLKSLNVTDLVGWSWVPAK